MKQDTFFELNTVRVRLAGLAHDAIGPVRATTATVGFVVYRANGDVHDSGALEYSDKHGWSAVFETPSLSSGVSEQLRLMIFAEVQGSSATWRKYITVIDETAKA